MTDRRTNGCLPSGQERLDGREPGWDPSVLKFVDDGASRPRDTLPAVSLFSNGGVGDYGYHLAGFDFLVHAEIEPKRCAVLEENYPSSTVLEGDLRDTWTRVVKAYAETGEDPPALLAASPPCQGMTTANQRSSSNSWRHEVREDDRNYLYDLVPEVAHALQPRLVVVENVPGILVTGVRDPESGRVRTVAQALLEEMPGYREVPVRLQMADYGVPQMRERAFFVFAREDEEWFGEVLKNRRLPLPSRTHGPHRKPRTTLRHALSEDRYNPLDGRNEELATDDEDPYHFVPTYDKLRYSWVSRNPPYKGKSCFENLWCETCEDHNDPPVTARCRECHRVLRGVPRVYEDTGHVRPVKGRKTAYKRMDPDRPAPTITTASGHVGSDTTLHPWQHRVLSIRECADLQTIPRDFTLSVGDVIEIDLTRAIIGEAIPPWFTYNAGRLFHRLLQGETPRREELLKPTNDVVVEVDNPYVAPITGSRPVNPKHLPSLNGSKPEAEDEDARLPIEVTPPRR